MDIRIEITKLIVVLFALGPVVAENWPLKRKLDKHTPLRDLRWLPENSTERTVESIPIALYEVEINEMTSKSASRVLKREVLKLKEVTLYNTQPSSMKVESEIRLYWRYDSRLSSNVSMLEGINTIISLDHNNIRQKFKWNKEVVIWSRIKTEVRSRLYSVSAFLPAKTGVSVTVQAAELDVEDSLVGSLSTLYYDTSKSLVPEIPQPIAVVWRRTESTDFETVYGSMFPLFNNSTTATTTNSSTVEANSTSANTMSTNNSVTQEKDSSFITSTNTSTTFPAPSTSTRPPTSRTTTIFPDLTRNTTPSTKTTTTTFQPSTTYSPPPTSSTTTTNTPAPSTYSPQPTSSTTTTNIPAPSTYSPQPTFSNTTTTTTTTPAPTTTYIPSTTSTSTTTPAPITTTTPKNFVNFDMTLYFKLKMKIPVK